MTKIEDKQFATDLINHNKKQIEFFKETITIQRKQYQHRIWILHTKKKYKSHEYNRYEDDLNDNINGGDVESKESSNEEGYGYDDENIDNNTSYRKKQLTD